ncbi:single-stranded DNA-binding protein [Solidesulfovibrio sp. C21]|uniref:single-stranded DNA-binding protein n=1 Tax=Solidesulfovibrio sp. C21 TaxID=3398613 RepID=UPI0039FDA347
MAGSLNRVMLIGRLGQDPKLSYTQSGQAVCSASLATDEGYKDKDGNKVEKTEWHRLQSWGRTAELMANSLKKGSLIYVEGKLQTRKWQAQDGTDRYTTEVVIRNMQFLESRGAGGVPAPRDQDAPSGRQASGGGRQEEGTGPAFPSEASGMDDVPF